MLYMEVRRDFATLSPQGTTNFEAVEIVTVSRPILSFKVFPYFKENRRWTAWSQAFVIYTE